MGGGPSRPEVGPATPQQKQQACFHKFQDIVGQEKATSDELKAKVRSSAGIFLAEGIKKYLVDGDNNNCFILFPRGLSITWGEDTRYWNWNPLEEGSDAVSKIEVAELKDVCWLEIHGKIELSHLNPGVTYEVFFQVKLNENAFGWSTPVDLRLKLPDGRIQERKENLDKKPRGRWLPLKVGEIQPQTGQNGDIVISLFQYGGHWKRGLVIKGIIISPKK